MLNRAGRLGKTCAEKKRKVEKQSLTPVAVTTGALGQKQPEVVVRHEMWAATVCTSTFHN